MWQFGLSVVAFAAAIALIMWWLRTPPLHEAVDEGDLARVKALVEGGADVNKVAYPPGKSSDGRTALHLAARNRSLEIAEYLVAKGAQVKATTPRMLNTPLHFAADNNSREGTKIAEFLVASGATVDARNNDGYTPLHFAAESGSRRTLELLLGAGADLHRATQIGLTPLHCAARGNNRDAAELLVSRGADLTRPDKEGRTPLALAEASGSRETADYLRNASRDAARLGAPSPRNKNPH